MSAKKKNNMQFVDIEIQQWCCWKYEDQEMFANDIKIEHVFGKLSPTIPVLVSFCFNNM